MQTDHQSGKVKVSKTGNLSGSNPKISVIIAVKNMESPLERCIQSIVDQSYEGWEILVKDSESTDNTLSVLQKYSDHVAFFESSPDGGVYDAWNELIPRATGDWIVFLGADDFLWDETSFERLVPYLSSPRCEPQIVYTRLAMVDGDLEVTNELGRPWDETKEAFKENMTIPHPACFYHRSVFEEHGLFDPSFEVVGDYEFLLRVTDDIQPVFASLDTVVGMEEGGLSQNPEYRLERLKEKLEIRKRHGTVKSRVKLRLAYALYWLRPYLANRIGEENTANLFEFLRRFRRVASLK